MRSAAAAFVLVVLAALALLFGSVLKQHLYTPDGIVYARYAARDAGFSERDATLRARAFYERSSLMQTPRYRALVEIPPAQAFAKTRIFVNRLLYPWVVSLLLPLAGFNALFIVSAISYVLFGAVLFWALGALGKPWAAAVLSIVALALPLTRTLAGSDLTDMFGALWWTLALGALLHLLRRESRGLLLLLTIASVLLALTRPTPYLLLLPALAFWAARYNWRPLAATLAGVAAFAIAALATHAFGVSEQLRWVYVHENPSGIAPFSAWYRAALTATVHAAASDAVHAVVPVLLVLLLIYCWVRLRMHAEMAVLAAAGIACLLAIVVNPVPSSLERVVYFPLLPVFCAIAQAAAPAISLRSAARQVTA